MHRPKGICPETRGICREEREVSGSTQPLKKKQEQNSVCRTLLGEGAVYIVCDNRIRDEAASHKPPADDLCSLVFMHDVRVLHIPQVSSCHVFCLECQHCLHPPRKFLRDSDPRVSLYGAMRRIHSPAALYLP